MVTFIVEMRLIASGQPHQLYQTSQFRASRIAAYKGDRCKGIAPTRFYLAIAL